MLITKLNDNWEFSQAALNEWRPAEVPGTIHTDLLAHGLIEDPFFRTNEKEQQWIDKVDWEYRAFFGVDEQVIRHDVVELNFHGLDTYSDVFLNGHLILKAHNMFRKWSVNVKTYLVEGKNQLLISFQSPVCRGLSEQKGYGLRLPASNDQSENGGLGPNKISIFTRKAGYHFGWDWGPRFVTSGIWRPVELKAWNRLAIRDVFIHQEQISPVKADLSFVIELENFRTQEYSVVIETLSGELPPVTSSVEVSEGNRKISVPLTIDKPRLWWCNGCGSPEMYDFRITIADNFGLEQIKEVRTGFRSIRLVREPDTHGESFYFELNGRKVFAKGANYIPNDVFLPRVTGEDYQKVINDAVAANMNMIRVWGGGIYENDIFYELCDEKGILVWQDFMFACSMFPGDEGFLENVRQEAVENVIRLRNHPSMALWCGNNEIHSMWAWHGDDDPLGWKAMFSEEQRHQVNNAYNDLFHNILPDAVNQFAGGVDYWPSSPQAGYDVSKFADENTLGSGDQHYWGVWHGLHPFEGFDENVGRFMSEYGFQSFPEFETVKKYTIPSDWDIESEVMAAHQRSGIGNLRIKEYMARDYDVPDDFEQFLYMSQVLQAEGIKRGIEAHRRNMPRCMGSLYWQLNDCWPVASWASTDYYRKWKALHYVARKAFEPIIVLMNIEDAQAAFFVVSDMLQKLHGELHIDSFSFSGKKLNSITAVIDADSNASTRVLALPAPDVIGGSSNISSVVIRFSLSVNDKEIYQSFCYLDKPGNLLLSNNPEINMNIAEQDGKTIIELSSSELVKNLMLYIPGERTFFSDNYFDLLPGFPQTVILDSDLNTDEVKRKINVRHLVSS